MGILNNIENTIKACDDKELYVLTDSIIKLMTYNNNNNLYEILSNVQTVVLEEQKIRNNSKKGI